MQEQVIQKTADTAALSSGFFAGAAWVANVEPYLTAGAALVAIVSGAVAIWYHYERARSFREKRLEAAADRHRRREEAKRS